MEDFEKKVKITDEMAIEEASEDSNSKAHHLLRQFLAVQQRRAQAYTRLRKGFSEYMISGVESTYQRLCSEITAEFNDCSKQVRELEAEFLKPDCLREDLAGLLRSVQEQEKQKLQLTVTIQVLKKAGRPSERLVSHENCKFKSATQHECVHLHEITESAGTEEAEADAEFDNALKEAIQGVQDAVTLINDYLEEIKYEIAGLDE